MIRLVVLIGGEIGGVGIGGGDGVGVRIRGRVVDGDSDGRAGIIPPQGAVLVADGAVAFVEVLGLVGDRDGYLAAVAC